MRMLSISIARRFEAPRTWFASFFLCARLRESWNYARRDAVYTRQSRTMGDKGRGLDDGNLGMVPDNGNPALSRLPRERKFLVSSFPEPPALPSIEHRRGPGLRNTEWQSTPDGQLSERRSQKLEEGGVILSLLAGLEEPETWDR